jgi:D-alanine-D-alanine ligase
MRVAVLAGGRSSERDVSLASAASIRDGLEAAGHDVVWIEIDRNGTWRCDGEEISVKPGGGLLGSDVVFCALHGPYGEDGTVQGLLECLDVPYVGSDVLGSALCMDKIVFKQVMAVADMPQVDYRAVHESDYRADSARVLADLGLLGLPVFVKPARLGSSVGIAKVKTAEELPGALTAAFEHDPRVVVEAMASGLEVECSVLGTIDPIASEPGEIVINAEWYDYAAKYEPGGMELVVPARISPVARERVRALALRAFSLAGASGMARVDFFVDGDEVLISEVNTIPGFTPTSVYSRLLAATGIDYDELLERLLTLAVERHQARQRYRF